MTRALFVNGTRVFDGKDYERLEQGPGASARPLSAGPRGSLGERSAVASVATGTSDAGRSADPGFAGQGHRRAHHAYPAGRCGAAQYEARIALMASPAEIASIREQTIDGPAQAFWEWHSPSRWLR